MDKEIIREALTREPFEPFRLRLTNGKTFDVPFRDVARILSYGVLVFIGLREGTRSAKGYDRFHFENIDRIEPLSKRGRSGRRKKAS